MGPAALRTRAQYGWCPDLSASSGGDCCLAGGGQAHKPVSLPPGPMAFAKAQPPRTSLRYHADGAPLSPARSGSTSALRSPAPPHPGAQYSPRTGRKLPHAPGSGLFLYGSPRSRRHDAGASPGASSPLSRGSPHAGAATGAARAGISFAGHSNGHRVASSGNRENAVARDLGGYGLGGSSRGSIRHSPAAAGTDNFATDLAGIGRSLSGSERALSLMLERALIKIATLESQVGARPRVWARNVWQPRVSDRLPRRWPTPCSWKRHSGCTDSTPLPQPQAPAPWLRLSPRQCPALLHHACKRHQGRSSGVREERRVARRLPRRQLPRRVRESRHTAAWESCWHLPRPLAWVPPQPARAFAPAHPLGLRQGAATAERQPAQPRHPAAQGLLPVRTTRRCLWRRTVRSRTVQVRCRSAVTGEWLPRANTVCGARLLPGPDPPRRTGCQVRDGA